MRLIYLSTALLLSATTVIAQDAHRAPRGDVESRAKAEQEFQKKIEQVVREQLKLTDEQVSKLRVVSAKYSAKRGELMKEAGANQRELRKEVEKGDSVANQKRVAQLMEEDRAFRRRFIELGNEESKELAGFLSPVKVAQYQGLQMQLREQVRRRTDDGSQRRERRK